MGHAGNAVGTSITDSQWIATGFALAMIKVKGKNTRDEVPRSYLFDHSNFVLHQSFHACEDTVVSLNEIL